MVFKDNPKIVLFAMTQLTQNMRDSSAHSHCINMTIVDSRICRSILLLNAAN